MKYTKTFESFIAEANTPEFYQTKNGHGDDARIYFNLPDSLIGAIYDRRREEWEYFRWEKKGNTGEADGYASMMNIIIPKDLENKNLPKDYKVGMMDKILSNINK